MQPPRPFQGAPYDKNMFTFQPALANRDVSVDLPRKRKLLASDSEMTMAAPTMDYGSSGDLNPKENAVELGGKELPNFVPAFSPREPSTYRNYSNDFGATCYPRERGYNESRSKSHGYSSFTGEYQSSNYKDSSLLFKNSDGLTCNSSDGSPLVTKDVNQHRSDGSNAQVLEEEKGFHFPNCQTYGQQKPDLMKIEDSDSNKLALEEPQNLRQNLPNPEGCFVGSDENGCKVETSSSTQGLVGSDIIDCARILGNNIGNIYSLHEANNILQQALRLLSAPSGSGLTVNQDGISQGCTGDSMTVNTTPNSHTQNLAHSLVERTPAKGGEAGLNVDKPIITGEKSSVNVDDRLTIEGGDSALAEKLWDGTLQLSSNGSVSVIAFFKSGERMQDFSWSESLEIKGKVRLEAFEKYVQDIPRSRTRGLMVMSLCCKEGSSAAGLKGMKEVARKYREGKRVGLAQSGSGVDMYICPHSDAIITILAKHGFFKGMTAVTEKSDPLLGCVVWRKNSSAPATKTTVVNGPQSGLSPSFPSDSAARQVPSENSEKIQTEVGGGRNSSGNKSLEVCLAPCVDQPMILENKILPDSGNNQQLSECYSNVETNKPNSSIPTVLNQSGVLSDDEDLPEFDFGASVPQISEGVSTMTAAVNPTSEMELSRGSQVQGPIAALTRAVSPDVSGILSEFQLQGLQQHIKNQSEGHNLSSQAQQEQQSGDCTTSSRPSVHGLAPQNTGNRPDMTITSWSREEKVSVDEGIAAVKPTNLFDDDDMPEWHPPDFKKMRPGFDERVGPSFALSKSMVSGGSFTDLATGRQLPPPPPLPPLPPALAQVPLHNRRYPPEHQLPLPPPPPPPPRPPPSNQGQLFDHNYHTNPHLKKPAASAFIPESPVAETYIRNSSPVPSAHVPFQGKHYSPAGHLPPPPQLPPPPPQLPPPPLHLTQTNFSDKDHPPAPHFPKPSSPRFPRPSSPHFHRPSSPHFPKPSSPHFHRPSSPPFPKPSSPHFHRPSSPHFHRPSSPHFLKPSPSAFMHDSPAANSFMHNRPPAQPTHVRLQNQHYPPAPPLHPPIPDKAAANNFAFSSADVPPQMQFQNNENTASPPLPRPQAGNREGDGSRDEFPPFPPGFTPNPAFRPQYHQPPTNNHTYRSGWRSSRP